MTPDVDAGIDPASLPVLGRAYRLGVNPVTTSLVLLGPLVLALIAVGGRSPVIVSLALLYVIGVPGSIVYGRLVGTTDGSDANREGESDVSEESEIDDGD